MHSLEEILAEITLFLFPFILVPPFFYSLVFLCQDNYATSFCGGELSLNKTSNATLTVFSDTMICRLRYYCILSQKVNPQWHRLLLSSPNRSMTMTSVCLAVHPILPKFTTSMPFYKCPYIC